MAQYPALPLWTDSYIADTPTLNESEHGVYLLLLFYAWRSPNCCLPDNDVKIARMLRITPSKWRKKYKPVMKQFWKEKDGNLFQKRLSKERERVLKRSEAASSNANAKWRKNKNSDAADAYANGDAESLHSISISKSISMNKNSNSSKDDIGEKNNNLNKVGSLKAETYEEAHDIAPGYDIYYIENQWREGGYAAKARIPDKAFLGFTKRHIKENPL